MASQSTPDKNGSKGTWTLKTGLAQMLKGGVIMDVVTPEHAKIAEEAGAVAVMALERVPADIRAAGGVARMSDPDMIHRIMDAVTIPVMAKCRIGHFVEAQVLQAIGVDYIDESEVLTPADVQYHVKKHDFKVPFVCGARDLGEALRRIDEGAAMIRSKGEAGTGNIVEAVTHLRAITSAITELATLDESHVMQKAEQYHVPLALVKDVEERQAAGRALLRGRHRDARRRRAHHAARRGGELRGLGDLQVRSSGANGEGGRRGDDALQRRQAHRRRLAQPRRADARPHARDDPRGRTPCRPRPVTL